MPPTAAPQPPTVCPRFPLPGLLRSKFLSEHGGHTNAYTSNESTNYHFSVNPDHLEPALDRCVPASWHDLACTHKWRCQIAPMLCLGWVS